MRFVNLTGVLLAGVLLLVACGGVDEDLRPTGIPTPTATACPLSTTPERSMRAEATQVQDALTAAGVEAQVWATGLNHCPGLPAETVAWFTIRLVVDDLEALDAIGEQVITIIDAVEAWPEAVVFVDFMHAEKISASFTFTVAEARLARDQDLTGPNLLAALGYTLADSGG